ncbi:MAG: hypothetical protein ACD_63C00147G0001 [uncultured bacterium]|nr:MAG: hypothetical protein ACD_63C00147G0001 [uncultured bacterium]
MEEFKKNLSSSEKIMEDAVKIDDISVSTKAAPDSLGSEFVVNVEIRLTAVVFDEENLRKLAEERLLNQIPENKEFLEFDKDSFKCSLETYDLEKKEATFATHLEAKTISKLDEKLFDTEKLIGRTKAEVVEYLKEQKDVGEVQVEFKPFWVKTVPSQKDKVKLDIKDFDK